MNEELESAIYKWQPLNASLLCVFCFLFCFFPAAERTSPADKEVLLMSRSWWSGTKRPRTSESTGFTLGFDLSLRRAENERKPIHFSSVLLLCQSDFSVWFTSDIGLNAVFGKNCRAHVPVVVAAVSSG